MKKISFLMLSVVAVVSLAAVVWANGVDGTPKAVEESDTNGFFEPAYFPSEWAKESVEAANELGITDKEKAYNYQSAITREEFCEIVYNYISNVLNKELKPDESISVVDTENYAVQCLVAEGIIKGKSDDSLCFLPLADGALAPNTLYITFAPNDTLTREEAAVILNRMIAKTVPLTATELYFDFDDGNKISDWAESSVQMMCNMGIMKGIGNNRFAPKDAYTTEQAVAAVVRVYKAQSFAAAAKYENSAVL